MDEIQQDTQPMSDDQDLAKALAGISNIEPSTDMDFAGAPPTISDIGTQLAATGEMEATPEEPTPEKEPAPETEITTPDPIDTLPAPEPEVNVEETIEVPTVNEILNEANELDPIKAQALEELRPLIDKLNLPPEEKFETYLLLIRNSDDKTLIAPAHQTALLIEDETKKAEALLDIIKEIEYLSSNSEEDTN